jgi:hypothetical protein
MNLTEEEDEEEEEEKDRDRNFDLSTPKIVLNLRPRF